MKLSKMVGVACGFALASAVSTMAAPDPNFHIYIAFGQSNMEGQGDIEQQDKTVDPRFQMLATDEKCSDRKLGQWYDAVPPLAHCQGAKLGPTDYFGRTMVEKTDEKIKVGVIVVAINGCSIQVFQSNLDQGYLSQQASWFMDRVNAYGGNPYNRMIEMGKKAQEDGVIKGIIFHQGETDNSDAQWPSKVKAVYDNIIKDLGLGDDIPFLAGEVFRGNSTYSGALKNINSLPQQSKNFYVVSSEGFDQSLNDFLNVHFTTQEYRDFGKRYAEKMIEVLGDKINPVAVETPSSSSAAPESSSENATLSSSEIAASSSSEASVASSSEMSPASSSGTIAIHENNHNFAIFGKVVDQGNSLLLPITLNTASHVNVKIYSSLGKVIMSVDGKFHKGENILSLEKAKLPSGIYTASVQAGSARMVTRVNLIR